MASQQVLFSETVAAMKKAFKRKAYESDSDSEVEHYGNRGQKLKKNGRFARKGQLVPPTGPSSYKETIDYAGVRRSIIQRKPPVYDDEGDEIDTDDEDPRAEDAIASAADLNPYANIHIEQILSPLTASTDLSSHPTLSKPFTSKTLTELVNQGCAIMRKENHSLWQVRHLWTALCGDNPWVPCSTMVGPNDIELYTEDHVARHLLSLSKGPDTALSSRMVNGSNSKEGTASGTDGANLTAEQHKDTTRDADIQMGEAGPTAGAAETASKSADAQGAEAGNTEPTQEQKQKDADTVLQNGETNKQTEDHPMTDEGDASKANQDGELTEKPSLLHEKDARTVLPDSSKPTAPPFIVTTGSLDEPFIHPLFLPPAGSKPDRDLGLPEFEAEDVRRLLAMYVQKQEEICRGAKKLHSGLLRAERLRKEVLHWSKAEAHCGPNRDMSDGEDWYDKEEWGLAEDLKKGQDEEEEETTTSGKKTRARR